MSSPDPLHEPIPSSVVPFTRRVTRSQHTQRFASLSNSSPRKQTFELDVGNEISPQKIVVTVEAESERDTVSRRLFTSPARPRSAARRREATTTTKVPLKGVTDDEGAGAPATPRRRGRPKRTGTPTPSARKRAGTPTQKTPRQTRRAKTASEEPASEISQASSQAAPKSASRTRKTPAKRAPAVKKTDGAAAAEAQPKKRGRPRRQALAPEEVEALQDNFESTIVVSDVSSADEAPVPQVDPSPAPDYRDDDDDGEDIWMANLSEPPTPVPQRRSPRTTSSVVSRSSSRAASEAAFSDAPRSEAGDTDSVALVDGDGRSDVGSYISENPGSSRRDLDTIAQGEDFSMIAFDSMQSYYPNSSMREDQLPEMGETTSLVVSQTLESLRRSGGEDGDEGADADENPDLDLDATPKASSSARMASEPGYQHRPTSDGPLFSQPVSPQGLSRSPRRARATPLGRQLALKSLQKDSPAARSPGGPAVANPSLQLPEPQSAAVEDQSMYDDSFSEIPEAVLEAATPRRIWNRHLEHGEESEPPADDEDRMEESPSKSSVVSTAPPRSESSRMLTPDDTPSPALSDGGEGEASRRASDVTMASAAARSSPPLFGVTQRVDPETSSRHSRQSSTETPLASALSPHLPPAPAAGLDGHQNTLVIPSESSRPALSPIVRAGRALQSVTSDPPSPRDRESQLGSPFRGTQSPVGSNRETSQAPKSPATNAPQQPPPVPTEDRTWSKAFSPFNQLKNLVIQGAQVFSPRLNAAAALEDPFALGEDKSQPDNVGRPASRGSSPVEEAAFAATMNMSTRVGPPSDDGMDWEADPIPQPVFQTGTSRSMSSVFATKGSHDGQSLVMSLADDLEADMEPGEELGDAVESDEEDIWAVEAQRPTPAAEKAKANTAAGIPPRRSKLPSPWRKNSRRLLYSDELANIESPMAAGEQPAQASHVADYSMLSTQSGAAAETAQEKMPPKNKINLSAFFSSPAIIPQLVRPGDRPVALQDPSQLANGIPATNAASKAAVAEPSTRPQSRRGVPTPSQGLFQPPKELASVPQKGFMPGSQKRVDLFSPTKQPSAAPSQRAQEMTASPSTPERPTFTHIAQKRDFTPRQGAASSSLFGPVPAAQPATTQLDTELSSESLAEEDELADTSHFVDESSFETPVLKPLPDKLASPSKSSFRSPLKPKTPGRVVEFTSSTLSPLAQEQARAALAGAANPTNVNPVPGIAGLSSWGHTFMSGAPSVAQARQTIQVHYQTSAADMLLEPAEADKENEHSPTRLAAVQSKLSSSAFGHKPTAPQPAARRAEWSRAHWQRLDALVQERRRDGALNFQLRHPSRPAAGGGAPATPSKRPSAALLGKQVTSQGETMVLEQWHLDIVDAFGAEPAGAAWSEKDLAKRVFSLLVGEERRRLGLVPKRR